MNWVACVLAPILLHPVVNHVLTHYYTDFATHPRKLYIQKNIVKSVALASMVPSLVREAPALLLRNQWNYPLIRSLALMYGMIDGYSLVRYYQHLSETTRVHHTIVLLYSILNLSITDDPWRQLNIFGAVSVLTFPVNWYLGMRFLTNRSYKKLAAVVYVPAIVFNVMYQLPYMMMSPLYFILVLLLLLDDFVLLAHIVRP